MSTTESGKDRPGRGAALDICSKRTPFPPPCARYVEAVTMSMTRTPDCSPLIPRYIFALYFRIETLLSKPLLPILRPMGPPVRRVMGPRENGGEQPRAGVPRNAFFVHG